MDENYGEKNTTGNIMGNFDFEKNYHGKIQNLREMVLVLSIVMNFFWQKATQNFKKRLKWKSGGGFYDYSFKINPKS